MRSRTRMPLITQAKNLTLGDVQRTLNLREIEDLNFFEEYQDQPLELAENDQHFLDELRKDLR